MDYYAKDGSILNMEQWAEKHADEAYMRVARTTMIDVADPTKNLDVSTVWLGIDHGFGMSALPVIFETMVFTDGDGDDCQRYCTEPEAIAGHRELVARLSAEMRDPVVMDVA